MKLQSQAELLNYLPYYKRYNHFGERLITILSIRNNDNKNLKKKRKITCLTH